MVSITTGITNTGVGYQSGGNNATSSSNNTFIGGYTSASSSGVYNNSTALDYGATITGRNQIVIGTSTENVFVPNTLTVTGTITSGGIAVPTTTSMNTAIASAIVPYSTTTAMNTAIASAIVPYSTTTAMNTAISTATTGMDTITLRNTAFTSYSTTTGMNTAISTAIAGGLSSNNTWTGVSNTIQSADTILPITFTATPSFSMTSGIVCNFTTSSTAMTSLGFTNIPTTPQQSYVFAFVLNPSTANSAWWLKPPTIFLSITAVGGSINTAVPLVGMSNVVLPASYTYILLL